MLTSIFQYKNIQLKHFLVLSLIIVLSSCSAFKKGSATPGYYKVGQPYIIDGKRYEPKEQPDYDEVGIASWYGSEFHKKQTANGGTFDRTALTAAHRTLPLPSMVRVTNLENNKTLIVMVNDRGPFSKSRILDVSEQAAEILGFKSKGTAKVRVQFLPGQTKRLLADLPSAKGKVTLPDEDPKETAANEIKVDTLNSSPKISNIANASNDVIETSEPKKSALKAKISKKKSQIKAQKTQEQESIKEDKAETLNAAQIEEKKSETAASPATVASATVAPTTKIEEYSGEVSFIQAGTYGVIENAKRVEKKLSPFGDVSIVPIKIKDRTFYKVKIGPITDKKITELTLKKVITLGHPDAIIVKD